MNSGRNNPCHCGSGKKYKKCCGFGALTVSQCAPQTVASNGPKWAQKDVAPTTIELNHLVELLNTGRFGELEHHAQALITKYPDSGFSWKALGISLQAQGKKSIFAFQAAARLLPNDAAAHNNLAAAMKNLGQFDGALECCRRALAINPDFAEAHTNFGICHQALGNLDEALTSYRRALESKPYLMPARNNPDSPSTAPDQHDSKLAVVTRLLYRRMSQVFMSQGDFVAAKEHAELALAISPDDADTYCDLGVITYNAGRVDDSIPYFESAISVMAAHPVAMHYKKQAELAIVDNRPNKEKLFSAGLIREAEALARQELQMANNVENHNSVLMCYHANPGRTSQEYFEESRIWAKLHGHEELLPVPSEFKNDRSPHKRLKVGILGDYFESVIGIYTLLPFFRLYDREQLEIYCYDFGTAEQIVKPLVDHWRGIHHYTGPQFFNLVRSDGIDIMLDINGRLRNPRFFDAMLRQPAPVQVNWYNLTATVGAKAYNYAIADEYSIRPSEERLYVEKVFRMPTGTITAWDMGEPPPEPTPLPFDRNGFVTFACFGDFFKINETVLATWGKLLIALPGSHLYLKGNYLKVGEHRNRIIEYFAGLSVSADRLMLEGMSSYGIMKKRYGYVDIALDTFPYSGGSTTINALWQGVPIIAISGDSWRERSAASILAGCGLDELIATDIDDYLAKALALANDPVRMKHYRQTINRILADSPQWQTETFARNFEHRLRAIWRDWLCQSVVKAPRHHSAISKSVGDEVIT